MASNAFADWLARGLAHQRENRAADAIPCFRRAAREDPRSPVPWFHLGEVWWQLGLSGSAMQAWRESTQIAPSFVPAQLALAEALMMQRDFARAAAFASEAARLAPGDARARAAWCAARAATGDRDALRECAVLFGDHPAFAHAPSLAAALAAALEGTHGDDAEHRLVEALAAHAATLPAYLVAGLAEAGAAVPASIAARRFGLDEAEGLRRLAVALSQRDAPTAAKLANAYCMLCAAAPRPAVPLLWPDRTAGAALRVAWLMPGPGTAAWAPARAALAGALAARPAGTISLVVLCAGDAERTHAALRGAVPGEVVYVGMTLPADADMARLVAARDSDVLVDAVGLAVPVAALLLARPARAILAVEVGTPVHHAPLVDRTFASADALRSALTALAADAAADTRVSRTADELAHAWDTAVRLHQQGELVQAAAGYEDVLRYQPRFAPALHLAGVVAAARKDVQGAGEAFAAALAAEPRFVEARLAAAGHALESGDAERALLLVREELERSPQDVALRRMLGRIHIQRRDAAAAADTLAQLLTIAPADAEAHFEHGVALQRLGDVQGAARAYQRALTLRPELVAADFNLGVLFQQQGNRQAAIAAYSHVLAADRRHAAAYKHLGDVLLAAGDIDAWLANFRAFEEHCPKALPLAVYALEACQHQGDFERLERYLEGLRREDYQATDERELADCLESLLYLLLFFDVEPSLLLRFAQAYDAVAPRVYGRAVAIGEQRRPGPLRIGYLSGDLRNHVMGKMMWQAIANHDRARYALYFYSNSAARDEWTQRFEGVAARFVAISGLDDDQAVAQIRADDVDLLVDLSTHTQGARPGILARKPAPVQITHVASAGTVGLSQVDFKLTDRFADLPQNQEFQLERLLAMEGCVYPFRRVAPAAQHPFHRAALGIAPDAIVIGAFVNPLKLSRRCLRWWREVLNRIPRARLAFSPANPAMRASYARLAAAGGIAADRLLFLPQGRNDAENQARYALVDFVLDTMPFGGVNGTIEALDTGVPVVTLVGRRHGERTTYSILANAGVTETIAETGPEYVDIAVRLAEDATFRGAVRAKIARGVEGSVLSDMQSHTRHLEAAYEAALTERGRRPDRRE